MNTAISEILRNVNKTASANLEIVAISDVVGELPTSNDLSQSTCSSIRCRERTYSPIYLTEKWQHYQPDIRHFKMLLRVPLMVRRLSLSFQKRRQGVGDIMLAHFFGRNQDFHGKTQKVVHLACCIQQVRNKTANSLRKRA
jgi:hypothetical protein